jgi:hypothetical protein
MEAIDREEMEMRRDQSMIRDLRSQLIKSLDSNGTNQLRNVTMNYDVLGEYSNEDELNSNGNRTESSS